MDAQGYCVRCKTRREMKDAEPIQLRTGRRALKGHCAVCGAGMVKIVGQTAE